MRDEEIIALYWQRDEEAIGQTRKKYGGYLSKIAYNILFDREDSEESVNDTYLCAWNSMPPQKPKALAVYLDKLARQTAIDIFRKRNSKKRQASQYACSLEELEECLSGGNRTEQDVDLNLLTAAIGAYLLTLSDDARNLFIGRYYEAVYEEVASAGNDVLSKSLGGKLEDEKGCYRLGGHDDLQYVISDNVQAGAEVAGESYSLWEFQSFQTQGSYPYSDVLRLIYGLNSPDAIERMIVRPPTFDNTYGGMKIQKEIGTYEVTDWDAIETFYEVISGMVCYGGDHWELIDYGSPGLCSKGKVPGEPAVTEKYRKIKVLLYFFISQVL